MKEFTLNLGPSVELEQYVWLKVNVSATFTGSKKKAMKQIQLLYWEAVALDLKIRDELVTAYEKAEMKSIKKLVKKKVENLRVLTSKAQEG